MKKTFYLAMIIFLLSVATVFAQGNRYNPRTVEVIKGDVVSVERAGQDGAGRGLLLHVKTAKETIDVKLGPKKYVESQQFSFQANDKVEIKGSRVSINGTPTIIAAEVKKNNKTLKLRDDSGAGLWRKQVTQ